jgi:ENTH domain
MIEGKCGGTCTRYDTPAVEKCVDQKALQVFDYCVHSGSENVVRWGKDNLYVIKSLREFQHIDDDGVDQGANSTFPFDNLPSFGLKLTIYSPQ